MHTSWSQLSIADAGPLYLIGISQKGKIATIYTLRNVHPINCRISFVIQV